ncbi:MAG: hypothetical protein HQL87_15865 [Magnetococcales bacterium]|nr:hypothetical protein [Magnetococcales bacterium]
MEAVFGHPNVMLDPSVADKWNPGLLAEDDEAKADKNCPGSGNDHNECFRKNIVGLMTSKLLHLTKTEIEKYSKQISESIITAQIPVDSLSSFYILPPRTTPKQKESLLKEIRKNSQKVLGGS